MQMQTHQAQQIKIRVLKADEFELTLHQDYINSLVKSGAKQW
jgi:hypothetical protein